MTKVQTPEEIEKTKALNKRLELQECHTLIGCLDSLHNSIVFLKEYLADNNLGDEVTPHCFNSIEIDIREMRRSLAVIECCADENSPRKPLDVAMENVYGKKRKKELHDQGIVFPYD